MENGRFAFLSGLGTTYDVHVRFIGKRVVNFLLVLIELFSLGVTAEALQAKIDRKSVGGSVSTNLEGGIPTNDFCTVSSAN